MALNSTLVLGDATPTNRNFVTVSTDATGAIRIDDSTTLALPRYLTIRHSAQKNKAGEITDRHLVQLAVTKADASGKVATATVNVTIAVPRNGIVSREDVNHIVAFARAITGSIPTMDAILRNER